MVYLTEYAAIALHETLDAVAANADQGLRLSREGNRLILKLDSPGVHDYAIRHQNRLVLIVDRDTRSEIGDAVVDIAPSSDDPYLVLRKQDEVSFNDWECL